MAAACALLALAACGDEPASTPTPTLMTTPTPALAPTPTPTPTGPVRAEDDPSWTPRQSAAVRMVDAYLEVMKKIMADPANADLRALQDVAVNPRYDTDRKDAATNAKIPKLFTAWLIPVGNRHVSEETVVDGRTVIKVTQCDLDDPAMRVFDAGVERDPTGDPRVWHEYIVEWQDDVQDWRVAQWTKLEGTC